MLIEGGVYVSQFSKEGEMLKEGGAVSKMCYFEIFLKVVEMER